MDEKSHVIIGAEVFSEASERGLLQPMVAETRNRDENDLSEWIHPGQKTEMGFDAGYAKHPSDFSSENLQYCDEQDLSEFGSIGFEKISKL